MRASRRRVLLGAAAAVPAALAVAPAVPVAAATAAPPPPEEPSTFCSTTALSPEQLSAGVRSTVRCFDTRDEALRSVGLDPSALPSTSWIAAVTNNDPAIAVHYEHDEPGGVPLVVNGIGCNGGGISFNYGNYWNDRIRSTSTRSCSTIKHFADANFTGAAETVTSPGAKLNALWGQVSSIRYY